MMDALWQGFAVAATPFNLMLAFAGAVVGTVVGVLPGLGPTATMSILLPLSFGLGPVGGVIMLAGIWYGSQYGGSTTAILLRLPGEGSSVISALDGYRMAQAGRAGAALTLAAVGSWLAGTLSVMGLSVFAPPLARAALAFGPHEYFAVAVVGLLVLSNLTGGSSAKALAMAALGIMLSLVGMDPLAGIGRFTLDQRELFGGIEVVSVIMGLFGISELLELAEQKFAPPALIAVRLRELYPSVVEWKRSIGAMFRGGVLGFLIGLIPGPAALLASYASYAVEKRFSRHPEEFGHGAPEALAGPESANNSATGGAFVPLLALGLPFAPPTAVLLGALTAHGVEPGPLLMQQHPEVFWGVIASMYIGNLMLLVLNLPLVGVFTSLLRVPPNILMPGVVVVTMAGAYSLRNSMFDVWVMVVAGLAGYLMRKLAYDPSPLILGLVLGPMLESSLRQGMRLSDGNFLDFFARPISGTLLACGVLVLVMPLAARLLASARRARTGTVGEADAGSQQR